MSNYAVWILTLPSVTLDFDMPNRKWLNPDRWEGDWQRWRNRHTVLVAAQDETEARTLAAEHDCGVWLDPEYAWCRPLKPEGPGVIISDGSEAENE